MRSVRLIVAVIIGAASGGGMALSQEDGNVGRGLVVAQRECATCHGVTGAQGFSPVAKATPFIQIANTPGMTGMALNVWLTNPHPSMPNLVLAPRERADVIAYILSLKSPR